MDNFDTLNKAIEKIKAALSSAEQLNIAEFYRTMEPAFATENFRNADKLVKLEGGA